jgi:hypothetical protein
MGLGQRRPRAHPHKPPNGHVGRKAMAFLAKNDKPENQRFLINLRRDWGM